MAKRAKRKDIPLTKLRNNLFITLAPKVLYGVTQENLVLSKWLLDFSNSVLMFSHVYRPVFREKFQDALIYLTRDIKQNPMLFAYTFTDFISTDNYTPYKFIISCAFISELHFFLCEYQPGEKEEYYITQSNLAFNDIFGLSFKDKFRENKKSWRQLFWAASKVAKKFSLLKPFMNGETLNETEKPVTAYGGTSASAASLYEITPKKRLMVIAKPGGSRKIGNLPQRSFQAINEIKSESIPGTFLQHVDSRDQSPNEKKLQNVKSLFLSHLTKQCSINEESDSEICNEPEDSSTPIESPNSPLHSNACSSNSTSEESRKRKVSPSNENSSKRLKHGRNSAIFLQKNIYQQGKPQRSTRMHQIS